MKKLDPQASKGTADWFNGDVTITPIKPATETSNFSVSSVHFEPGARAAWHVHPYGQTLYVTEGVGYVQSRGGPIETIRPGDIVWTEPGEEHWHGATAGTPMTHIAMQESDEQGNFAEWHNHVTDEEYGQSAKI